ncbi:MAG: DUF1292 domain-containing protein [Christensenellaceae bacterium]|nr:DUF1292 domain-containing protein [Christensenellaceae bacterium]
MSKELDKNNEVDTVELMDEDGKKYVFENLLTFEVDDDFYIAMTPMEATDEFAMDEVFIMKVVEDEEGESYLPIESQEELDALWNIFQDLYYEDEDAEE